MKNAFGDSSDEDINEVVGDMIKTGAGVIDNDDEFGYDETIENEENIQRAPEELSQQAKDNKENI